jgi:hypothetical protein
MSLYNHKRFDRRFVGIEAHPRKRKREGLNVRVESAEPGLSRPGVDRRFVFR